MRLELQRKRTIPRVVARAVTKWRSETPADLPGTALGLACSIRAGSRSRSRSSARSPPGTTAGARQVFAWSCPSSPIGGVQICGRGHEREEECAVARSRAADGGGRGPGILPGLRRVRAARRPATCRNFPRLAARKRPNNRPFLSFSSALPLFLSLAIRPTAWSVVQDPVKMTLQCLLVDAGNPGPSHGRAALATRRFNR